jgi:hypothetical protein
MMYAKGEYVRAFHEVIKNAPVTVPALEFLTRGPPVDTEPERREVAARFAEHRTIKAGVSAWESIHKAERETYDKWLAVARSLAIGRSQAMRAAGTDVPKGPRYGKALRDWLEQHFSNRPLPKQTRYWCIQLHENLPAIEDFRQSLSGCERQKNINPQSVVRRFLQATRPKSKSDDPVKAATVAWKRFVACVEVLSSEQAKIMWQSAIAEATPHVS